MPNTPQATIMVTVQRGAILCPVCRARIPAIRVFPETTIRHLSLMCRKCKSKFLVDLHPGRPGPELHESQRH